MNATDLPLPWVPPGLVPALSGAWGERTRRDAWERLIRLYVRAIVETQMYQTSHLLFVARGELHVEGRALR